MGHIGRLIGYSLRHKGILFGFLASAGIGTIFNLLAPLVLIHIIDNVILADNLDQLLPNVLFYISLGGLYAIFDIVGRYGAAISSQRVIYDLRKDIYDSLMEKDLAFYDENETGQLLARATTDVTTMREFLFWGIRVMFIGSAMLVGTFVVMYTVSPELTRYMFLL
ncbi:MAG: ABC transporter transmembrane domain-containing protein, partial [Candidatus Thorarchaeota archaeon]